LRLSRPPGHHFRFVRARQRGRGARDFGIVRPRPDGRFPGFLIAGPAQNPGVFQYGLNQVEIPFGNNFVCAAGPGNRVGISFAHNSNFVSLEVDLNAPEFAAFPITAGSTWYFQAWHRDHCGSGSALTDGLEITFSP